MQPPYPCLDDVPLNIGGRLYQSPLDTVRQCHAKRVPALRLAEFVAAAWHVVEPSKLVWNWHMDCLCDHLEAQWSRMPGRPWAQDFLVDIPPGTTKSMIASVFGTPWVWLFDPSWRLIAFSSNPSVTSRDSVKCRELIESAWYQTMFQPKWRLSDDQNAKLHFKNSAGGFRKALTAGQRIIGDRGDALLIDDPQDAVEVYTKANREGTKLWYDQGVGNRLNNLQTGTRTCIMQRLHVDDLAAHLLKLKFHHLNIPMEYERNTSSGYCNCNDCQKGKTFLGWTDPRIEPGELLFPERFPMAVLEKERERLGEYGYAGQMQQRPVPLEGGMYKRDWWRFYTRDGHAYPRPLGATQVPAVALPDKFDQMILTWDCSFKDLKSSDPVCGLCLGRKGSSIYVLAIFWQRAGLMKTLDAIRRMAKDWPKAVAKYVEDKANGTAVVEVLSTEISGMLAVEPEGGKESRAAAELPKVEAGNVFLPEGADWLPAWFDEFGAFPFGAHDDAVDALSQGMRQLSDSSSLANTRAILGLR